jgi:iron complex transport system substrate-binding protein
MLAVLGLLAGAAWALAQPLSVQDDAGTAVVLAQPAQRVVSVLPSLSETVCALGACARLVGVDRYSDEPPALQRLPQVGGGLDPNLEAIVRLRPDLVLMAGSTRQGERLRALGLKVLALEPHTQADSQRVWFTVAQALGVARPEADALWQRLQNGVNEAVASVPAAARGQRVYIEVNDGPFAASESSFIGEILTRLGARNILPASLGPFPQINPEFVVRADPDLIVVPQRSAASLRQRPGWAALRALRQGRVCVFSTTEANALVRPGPHMDAGARWLAQCLARQPVTVNP